MTALSTEPASEPPLYRYRFDAVEFDETRFELVVGGLPVELEHKPLQVLGELLRHVGEVVTRQELLERVWAGRPTVDNVLPNAVAKLRKALGPAQAERIVTLPRLGYRLNGPVERSASGRRQQIQPDRGFCYGRAEIVEVIDYTKPSEVSGVATVQAHARLRRHVDAEWARDPALAELVAAGDQTVDMLLVKKAKGGWSPAY